MISVEFIGRLGNQMFQYTILRIVAKLKNYNYCIKDNWLGYNIFDSNMNYNKNFNTNKVYNGHGRYSEDVLKIDDNTLICGYFQNIEYFENYYNDILEWFKIKDNINIDNFLNKYNINDYCYIHFRGTDYKEIPGFFLHKEYYEKAKNKILNDYKNLKFLIITDDIPTAKEYFSDDEILSNSMEIDFKLLNKAKYSIISNSTFSWWSRYLNNDKNSITIAPKGFFNYNTIKKPSFENLETNKFIWID